MIWMEDAIVVFQRNEVPETAAGWNYLNAAKDDMGRVILSGTLTKSYLPKEKIGKPSAWSTFYALLADKERNSFIECNPVK